MFTADVAKPLQSKDTNTISFHLETKQFVKQDERNNVAYNSLKLTPSTVLISTLTTASRPQSRIDGTNIVFFNANHCWVRNVKDMSKNIF